MQQWILFETGGDMSVEGATADRFAGKLVDADAHTGSGARSADGLIGGCADVV